MALGRSTPSPPPRRSTQICPQCNYSRVSRSRRMGMICKICKERNTTELNRGDLERHLSALQSHSRCAVKHEPSPKIKLEPGTMAICQNCHDTATQVEVDEDGQALCFLCLKPFRFRELPQEVQDLVCEFYIDDYIRAKVFANGAAHFHPKDTDYVANEGSMRIYAKHVEKGSYFQDHRFTLGSPFEKVDREANHCLGKLLERKTMTEAGAERIPIMVQIVNWNFNSAANLIATLSAPEGTDFAKGATKLYLTPVCIDPAASIDEFSLECFLNQIASKPSNIPFEFVLDRFRKRGMYLPPPLEDDDGLEEQVVDVDVAKRLINFHREMRGYVSSMGDSHIPEGWWCYFCD